MALTEDAALAFYNEGRPQAYGIAAGEKLFRHALVCMNENGHAVPASDAAGLSKALGIANAYADNIADGAADGDVEVVVRRGELIWIPTSGATKLTQADVGRLAHVVDDNTVAKAGSTTHGIVAGEVVAIRTDEALIKVGAR